MGEVVGEGGWVRVDGWVKWVGEGGGYVFVPKLSHLGNHSLSIMAHFGMPILELSQHWQK